MPSLVLTEVAANYLAEIAADYLGAVDEVVGVFGAALVSKCHPSVYDRLPVLAYFLCAAIG